MAADLRDRRLIIALHVDGLDIAIGYISGYGAQHWTRAGVTMSADPDVFRAAVLEAVARVGFAAAHINLRD